MDIAKTLRESCFCEGRGCELCRAADEIDRLRAELAEAKRIDCRSCFWFGEISRSCLSPGGGKACGGSGIKYVSRPVRLYEIDAAMAGGAK